MNFWISLAAGFMLTFVATGILVTLGQMFQLWRVLPERTVLVYTFFGKVIGQVEEPGLFFPIVHFGWRSLLMPFFGKTYTVSTQLHQSYLRNASLPLREKAAQTVLKL